ncbi:MAG: PAS domain S-box protein [Deltaproteobacteria bacterium]|nr:PAS domain S-box protein [Deltaproteobacteria bacterium]MBW2070597.1 PAS domain S-box protein [Deltaproteobacteria bacterium]
MRRPRGRLHLETQNLATMTLGIVLVCFIAYLLMANYRSQVSLRQSALSQLEQDTEKRAEAVLYFFDERRQDLESLARSRVVANFFRYKALEPTPSGMDDRLAAIGRELDQLLDARKIGGQRIYSLIVLVNSAGEVLAASQSDRKEGYSRRNWRNYLTPDRTEAALIPEASKIMVSLPYYFQGRYEGQIIARVVPQSVYDHLVKVSRTDSQFVGISSGKDTLYAPEDMPLNVLFSGLTELRSLENGQMRKFRLPGSHWGNKEMFAIKVAVGNTPFSLVSVLPASEVFGRADPWHLLLAMVVLSILILGGLAFGLRLNTHRLVLSARLEEAARREREVEEKNRQLQSEIVERQKAEEELKKSEERYRLVVEDMPDMICRFLPDGTLTFVNSAYCSYLGLGKEDLLGKNLFQSIPEKERQAVRHCLRSLRSENPIVTYEHQAFFADGSLRWQQWTYRAIFDEAGELIEYQSLGSDVTEKKRAQQEKYKLEKQLQHAQKMEAIGTLAGGISHDFNNLLQAVLGYAELLLIEKKEGDPGYRELQQIVSAAKRGSELTRQMLTFSRKMESKRRPVNLNHEVEKTKKLLEHAIEKMIDIELHLEKEVQLVNADPVQMEQIIMNLAVNAKDAMPEGGKLLIETRNTVLDQAYCKSHMGARPGEYVKLSISDTGHGMDSYTLEHIFEPFFSTKVPGQGTGLGLAMVYGIVKGHDGYITCSSELGKGTSFEIYLPAIRHEMHDAEVVEGQQLLRGGNECVLLVDDEPAIRDLGERILRSFGYTVLVAGDGETALTLYDRERGRIDLIILDLIMPGMGGRKCLEKILEVNPAAKVLIASGHSPNGPKTELLAAGAKGFFAKPYKVTELLAGVREILDGN